MKIYHQQNLKSVINLKKFSKTYADKVICEMTLLTGSHVFMQ